jgi:hypothetical protein
MWLKSPEVLPLPLKVLFMGVNIMTPAVATASGSMIFLPVFLIILTQKLVGLRQAMSVCGSRREDLDQAGALGLERLISRDGGHRRRRLGQ